MNRGASGKPTHDLGVVRVSRNIMLKFIGGTVGVIFLIGLVVVVGPSVA